MGEELPVGVDSSCFKDYWLKLQELLQAVTCWSWNLRLFSGKPSSLLDCPLPFFYLPTILLILQERDQGTTRRIVLLRNALFISAGLNSILGLLTLLY